MKAFFKIFALLASLLFLLALSGCEQAGQAKQAAGIESMMTTESESDGEDEDEGEDEDKEK